jgi:hypothetical protein
VFGNIGFDDMRDGHHFIELDNVSQIVNLCGEEKRREERNEKTRGKRHHIMKGVREKGKGGKRERRERERERREREREREKERERERDIERERAKNR